MFYEELMGIADTLQAMHDEFAAVYVPSITKVMDSAVDLSKSWSGSNLGYQSEVYYAGLQPRPAGANFSIEWGIEERWGISGTTGDWREYTADFVTAEIYRRAGNPDLTDAKRESALLAKKVLQQRAEIISILTAEISKRKDNVLQKILVEAEAIEIGHPDEMIRAQIPSHRMMTRDSLAATQGARAAPHQRVIGEMAALASPYGCAGTLSDIARRGASHGARIGKSGKSANVNGKHIFIGHGRSLQWRVLKDFLTERLGLTYDEFNRVPVAGVSTLSRLSEMLSVASMAFIVLTAEDETRDGKLQARMNVIHEAGLFQGRLGFTRAILLLEDGCEEFSNIAGLGQIRFPKGGIEAAFEQVRSVVEREGLLKKP